MGNAALQLQNHEIALNIVSGPDKGVTYKLLGNIIKIGRADDNDVVVPDNRASRYHAQVENRNGDFWIVDTGSAAGLLVNGQPVREKQLVLGDQIQIADTAIVYGPATPAMSMAPSISFLSAKKNNKAGSVLLIVVVAVGIAFFLSQGSPGKKKDYKIKDEEALSADIENLSQDNELRQQEIMKKGKDTQQYAEAQAFYQRGFRDFREDNYTRAIQFFETALTLYPDHPLAKRYLARSRLKLNQSIAASMERGEKYFQSQKYINAFNEYRNVILLTNDPNNKNAQLARKRIEAINLILMNSR